MKKNLLLVDDNREFALSLAETIKAEGYQVLIGNDSPSAIEINRRAQPQVAVIDAALPGKGSLHLLERLLEANQRLAVIMLTGKISEQRAIEALNLGAFGYTMKFSPPEEIMAHIRRATQHQESIERAGFSRSLFRTIFERTSDGICVLEDAREGRITELNLPFARILGMPRRELEGCLLFELGPPGDPQNFGNVVRPLLEQRSFALDDVKVRLPDGRLRDLELRTGPLLGDQRGPVQLLARDITENKRMREKIAHQEKLAMLGEFTSRVAHEVRNPLAGIKGALEILQMNISDDNKDKQVFNTIFTRIDQLDLFIRDLLQFSKPTTPEPRQAKAQELLPKVLSLVDSDPLFEEVNINLEIEEDATIYVDPVALQLILANLLRNAAEAMEGKGRIVLSLRHTYPDVIIQVDDRGPGFAGDPSKFFSPFTTTRPAGTGLGLSITRNLVESHGGSITGENRPKGGARIEILLPGPPGVR